MGLRTDGFYSLFSRFNKSKGKENDKDEGLIEELGELTLDTEDKDLLALYKSYELLYSNSLTKKRIHEEGDVNQRYWLGRQFPDSEYENGKRPLTDNIIFEGVETMIPLATQQNPEPIILVDDTPEMKTLGDTLHSTLKYLAEYNHLKTKLKKGVRHWSLRFIGCWQVGYDAEDNEIILKTHQPKDLILDPNGHIEDGKYVGEFLGIKMQDTARNMITRFPKKEKEITRECQGKMGSLIGYVQWWTDETLSYQMKDIILHKSKNPHFNYDTEQETVNETGQPITQTVPGKNHFKRPKMPFIFLTVFDLGDEPADKTGLIAQGLVTQDNINKRLKQIDRNNDNINGGVVVNGLMFSKEQAAQVAEARRTGRTIVVQGNPSEGVAFPQNQIIPDSLYQSLNDARQRFMARFGVSGSTSSGTHQEETVRGKIIVGQQDTSRIGGGITEFLELASQQIFDHFLQFIYVYYDEPHMISVLGQDNAMKMMSIQASQIPADRKIEVAVQNGSFVPSDELSEYNSAMSEWEGGVLDPLSFFEKTKDINPQQRAERLMIYKTNPALYMQQYLQIQPVAPAPPIPVGGGGSESREPGVAVSPNPPVPSPIQAQESQLISQVPIPK